MKVRIKQSAMQLPHIGMRKIKSILAIFVGFWLWQLIRLFVPVLEEHPIFIYIYGVLEMRESSEKTVDYGKRRIKATLIALIIGVPVLLLSRYIQSLTAIRWLQVGISLTAIMIGALLTLCVAEITDCKFYCGLAAAIFIILMVSASDGAPLIYSILRAVQTVIGVFVAWLINVKLFPYHGHKKA